MSHPDFLCGVVEGFYGQPWTMAQRRTLFQQLHQWGLNTYFYAPKDDLKHRALWRETYDQEELADLEQIVDGCTSQGIRVVYGLSPGLDIEFSDPAEFRRITQRLEQLIAIGVRDFALLFDDLPGKVSEPDRKAFDSVAAAQSHVTQQTFLWLREQFADSRLLFCPTPYCDRMDRWQLGGENYLSTIGELLPADIGVFWTGPEIISAEIPEASLDALIQRLQRKPVLWDNLHANDYDGRRLYCGPYSGRSAALLDRVQGIFVNPNNEFWINFVPLRTFADFLHQPTTYEPRSAFLREATEWAAQYETVGPPIPVDDVLLLADCYYLPHRHGEAAQQLQGLVRELFDTDTDTDADQWQGQYDEFLEFHARIDRLFERLTQLKHRELFYAWSRRVWDLREELDLIRDFLAAKQKGVLPPKGFASETHLLHTYRGGFVADLQRRLSIDAQGRIRAAN